MKRKMPLSAILIAICLGIILIISASLVSVYALTLRSVSNRQIEASTSLTVARLRDSVVASLNIPTLLLDSTAGYVSSHEDREAIFRHLVKQAALDPNITSLYFANNVKWNERGGIGVFSDGWVPDADYDQTKRDWFVDAKKANGKIVYTAPYVDADTKKIIISLSRNVYGDAGSDAGVVAVDLFVDSLVAMLREKSKSTIGDTYLLDSTGLYITHQDIEHVMQVDFFAENGLEEFKEKVLSSDTFSSSNEKVLIYSSLVPGSNWVLINTVAKNHVYAETDRIAWNMALLAFAILLASSGASVFMASRITRPYKQLEAFATTLSNGDFSGSCPDFLSSEAAALSAGFNRINANLSVLIGEIRTSYGAIEQNGTLLKASAEQTINAVQEIVDSAGLVKDHIGDEAAMIRRTAESVKGIENEIAKLNVQITEQVAQISLASTAIEEMSANIKSIDSNAEALTAAVSRLVESAKNEQENIQKSAADIRQVDKDSESLFEMNEVISNVASQTNLLAMNAAIEAAHAGEAGKGFAVVADEIRHLAETTAEQVNSSEATLRGIRQRIASIAESSQRVEDSSAGTRDLIRQIDRLVLDIKAAMSEQAVGSSQILESIIRINEISGTIQAGSGSIRKETDETSSASERLAVTSEKVLMQSEAIAADAQRISQAAADVGKAVERNEERLGTLEQAIDRFSVREDQP